MLLGVLLLAWLLMVAATMPLRWGDEPSPRNACVACGYDFLALPRAEVCPECGMGRYDEPPRRMWGIRWGRSALALAVALGPGAAVFGAMAAGVRNLYAPLTLLPDAAEGLFAVLMLIAAVVVHAFVCWAILGPHHGKVRHRWVQGHCVGALGIVVDVCALMVMVLSAA